MVRREKRKVQCTFRPAERGTAKGPVDLWPCRTRENEREAGRSPAHKPLRVCNECAAAIAERHAGTPLLARWTRARASGGVAHAPGKRCRLASGQGAARCGR